MHLLQQRDLPVDILHFYMHALCTFGNTARTKALLGSPKLYSRAEMSSTLLCAGRIQFHKFISHVFGNFSGQSNRKKMANLIHVEYYFQFLKRCSQSLFGYSCGGSNVCSLVNYLFQNGKIKDTNYLCFSLNMRR